jgi:putative pyruvate formate lyase activating enzyme
VRGEPSRRGGRLLQDGGACPRGELPRPFGEEAPLVGTGGSGTIFLSSCNLRCIFCQNFEISHGNEGDDTSADRLAAMMVRLRERGCHNINFVTPTHVVPQIIEALPAAIAGGAGHSPRLQLRGIRADLDPPPYGRIFDIYMPDFKFWDDAWSTRLCEAPDYRTCRGAIHEMHRQVGDLALDETGTACRGLLVRHLVMPNSVAGTDEIVRFLAMRFHGIPM